MEQGGTSGHIAHHCSANVPHSLLRSEVQTVPHSLPLAAPHAGMEVVKYMKAVQSFEKEHKRMTQSSSFLYRNPHGRNHHGRAHCIA